MPAVPLLDRLGDEIVGCVVMGAARGRHASVVLLLQTPVGLGGSIRADVESTVWNRGVHLVTRQSWHPVDLVADVEAGGAGKESEIVPAWRHVAGNAWRRHAIKGVLHCLRRAMVSGESSNQSC